MAITPLSAGGDAEQENPCIYVSTDGDTWVTPPGLTNPVDESPDPGYNADTELLLVGDTMYLFYTENSAAYHVKFRTSTDGIAWSGEQTALTSVIASKTTLSPAIVVHDGLWHMWTVDSVAAPNAVEYRTASAPAGPWTLVGTCGVSPAWPADREAWHLTVRRVAGAWHMLLADTELSSSGGGCDLYFLTSEDGLSWTRDSRPLTHRVTPYSSQFYRSACVPKVVGGRLTYDVWANVVGQVSSLHRRLVRGTITFDRTVDPLHTRHTTIMAARLPLYPYVAGDTFQRADGAIGTADSRQTWEVLLGSPAILGGMVSCATAGSHAAVIDTGIADGYVELDLRTYPSGGNGWIIFRAVNATNYWQFGWDSGLRLRRRLGVGISDTVRLSNPGTLALTQTPVTIGVKFSGSTITPYVNGTQWGDPVVDSTHATATKHGLGLSATATRLGPWSARAL